MMARLACALCALVAFAVSMPATASAQQTAEAILAGSDGASLFRTYCASCHGKEAKGDGPSATVKQWILTQATPGVIADDPAGTPNRLLSTGGL